MNVQESLLRERVDPALTDEALGKIAAHASFHRAQAEAKGTNAAAASDGQSDTLSPAGPPVSRVQGYQVLTGGCWNRVIAVRDGGRDLVYKISPHTLDEKIIREFKVLSAFADGSGLPVPRALYLDRGKILPGTTLVMSRIPGEVMHHCFGLFGARDRDRITDQIAEDLAELHTRKARGFGGVETCENERLLHWPDFWLPRFDRVIEEAGASGVVPSSLVEGAREIRPHLASALEIGSESTMTHYDIWSGNVMIDVRSSSPSVAGYIDIPGFYADYARELSFAMLFGVADRRFFSTYLRHHTLDARFELRVNIYNLKMNVRHVLMYPSEGFYRRGAESNLDFIRGAL